MSPSLEVVGRESEIDSVHDFLEAVPGGPVALLIEGEAGIGKTTLWREGIADAGERGLQVLTSRPVEAEIALPFAVLGDLLGDVPDAVLGRLPDPQREALEVALLASWNEARRVAAPSGRARRPRCYSSARRGHAAGRGDRRHAVARSTFGRCPRIRGQAIARRANRLPPRATRGRRAKRSQLELETALDADRLTRLVIGPLDIRSLDRLLRAQLGRQFLRPALVELQRVSGGNPFFALELGRALLARDVSPAPGEPLPVPATSQRARSGAARRNPHRGEGGGARRLGALAADRRARGCRRRRWGWGGRAREGGGRRSPGGRATAASGSHIRCSPRSSTRRHRRLGDANCTPAWRRSSTIRTSRRVHLALAASGPDAQVAATVEDAARRARARGAPQAAAELWDRARMLTPPDDADAWRRTIEAGECHLEAGTPTGRDVCSRTWWRAFLRVASAPSRSRASRGSAGSGGLPRLRRSVPRCARRDRRRSCGAHRDRTGTRMEHPRDR